MRRSPLQLLRYFVDEISCTANPNYDLDRDLEVLEDQFKVTTAVRPPGHEEAEKRSWVVEMLIHQQIGPNQNFPYEFKLSIVGFFDCYSKLPSALPTEYFVKVNGCSVLYGVAREMIRATTARGPWSDVMIPTLSFYERSQKSEVQDSVKK